MTNYASHVTDRNGSENHSADLLSQVLGLDHRARADIVKPGHVRFLDFEVEIGLVVGQGHPASSTSPRQTFPMWWQVWW